MKVIYMSGPFAAKTRWEVECNVRHVHQLGLEFIKLGWSVSLPTWLGDYIPYEELHNILLNRGSNQLEENIIASDCELVRRADAICVCKGWRHSRGAKAELKVAFEHDKEIWREIGNLDYERVRNWSPLYEEMKRVCYDAE